MRPTGNPSRTYYIRPGNPRKSGKTMPATLRRRSATATSVALPGFVVVAGALALAIHLDIVLSSRELATQLVSDGLWHDLVLALGGKVSGDAGSPTAVVPAVPLVAGTVICGLALWLAGARWIATQRGISFLHALCLWGHRGWLWWLLPVIWELAGIPGDLL